MSTGNPNIGRRSAWLLGSLAAVICASLLFGSVLAPAARVGGRNPVPLDGNPTAVAFSPDSKLVATSNAASNTISIFKAAASLDPIPGSPFHTAPDPLSVTFSPNGKLLAVASGRAGEVILYQVAGDGSLKRAPESPIEGLGGARQVAFTPNGKVLVVLGSGSLAFFSVDADGRLHRLSGSGLDCGGYSFAISPDGKLIACAAEGRLNVLQLSVDEQGVRLHPLPGMPLATGAKQASSVAFDPDGKLIAVGNEDPQTVSMFVVLTDVTKPIEVKGSPFDNLGENQPDVATVPSAIAFSPNGRVLAATNLSFPIDAGNDWSSVNFFSVGDSLSDLGRLTPREKYVPINGTLGPPVRGSTIAFSPDGRWFAATTTDGAYAQGWLALFTNPQFSSRSHRH